MKTLRLLPFLIFFSLFLPGCGNLGYLSSLGWHQAYIAFHSIPVQDILKDERMDTVSKEKILLIQEVKRYGEERMGLRRTKSYSKYFKVKGPVLYVVTASEKDRLQLHQWNFPIVGKVTYKGFFTREGAFQEERFLKEKELDTYVQGAGAYSTLGWLRDPIFSSMIHWEEAALANLILHEMAHATVYLKSETDFNEQVAMFIGNKGSIEFLKERFGPVSKQMKEAIQSQEDDLLFAEWINQGCERLSAFYAKEISREEKLRGREAIFDSLKEEWKGLEYLFQTDGYKNFENLKLNNAVLLAHRRYLYHLKEFEGLYEYFGRDLRRVIEFLKGLKASGGDPRHSIDHKLIGS